MQDPAVSSYEADRRKSVSARSPPAPPRSSAAAHRTERLLEVARAVVSTLEVDAVLERVQKAAQLAARIVENAEGRVPRAG